MLACARIGAPHVVVFGGFSAESLAERMRDAGAKVLITQDEGWRKGAKVPLKRNADDAVESGARRRAARRPAPDRRRGAVGRRSAMSGGTTSSRVRPPNARPERMNAEDPLFLLHTSGTTAKPKGAQHTTAGYLLHVVGHAQVDLRHPRRHGLVVRGRRRLGHRPQLHRLRAAEQRHDERALRGRPSLTRTGTATGRSSSATASTRTTRRRR